MTLRERLAGVMGVLRESGLRSRTFKIIEDIQPYWTFKGSELPDDAAERIARDILAEWLEKRGCSVHHWDGKWKVRMPKSGIGADYPEQMIRYNWTANYDTRLDALYAAVSAVQAGGKE